MVSGAKRSSKYPEISEASPVYAQMRSVIDLLVAAAFIREEGYYDRTGWKLGVLGDEAALPTETYDAPAQVKCAVNSQWKGSRLFTPAGGGVSIRADQAITPDRLYGDQDGKLGERYGAERKRLPVERWWWD